MSKFDNIEAEIDEIRKNHSEKTEEIVQSIVEDTINGLKLILKESDHLIKDIAHSHKVLRQKYSSVLGDEVKTSIKLFNNAEYNLFNAIGEFIPAYLSKTVLEKLEKETNENE